MAAISAPSRSIAGEFYGGQSVVEFSRLPMSPDLSALPFPAPPPPLRRTLPYDVSLDAERTERGVPQRHDGDRLPSAETALPPAALMLLRERAWTLATASTAATSNAGDREQA